MARESPSVSLADLLTQCLIHDTSLWHVKCWDLFLHWPASRSKVAHGERIALCLPGWFTDTMPYTVACLIQEFKVGRHQMSSSLVYGPYALHYTGTVQDRIQGLRPTVTCNLVAPNEDSKILWQQPIVRQRIYQGKSYHRRGKKWLTISQLLILQYMINIKWRLSLPLKCNSTTYQYHIIQTNVIYKHQRSANKVSIFVFDACNMSNNDTCWIIREPTFLPKRRQRWK